MTTPTLTCETCESEIDVAADPNCIQQGGLDVICEGCRERAWKRWMESAMDGEGPERACEALREAYRVKRGWRA